MAAFVLPVGHVTECDRDRMACRAKNIYELVFIETVCHPVYSTLLLAMSSDLWIQLFPLCTNSHAGTRETEGVGAPIAAPCYSSPAAESRQPRSETRYSCQKSDRSEQERK